MMGEGAIPSPASSFKFYVLNDRVGELVYPADLKSAANACRFESDHGHHKFLSSFLIYSFLNTLAPQDYSKYTIS
jgi:hypothetical protein